MIDLNCFHPFPRYGVAAAAVRYANELGTDFHSESDLRELARKALEDCLSGFLLQVQHDFGKHRFYDLEAERLDPGSKSGQVSKNGFFIAPHVLTSNNAADAVKEIRNLIELLGEGKASHSYELKRSFAPLVAKINAGNPSMSNPRVDLLHAAFTAVAMATRRKPAAYNYDLSANVGIIPDLPFFDTSGGHPLLDFIKFFKTLQEEGLGNDANLGSFDEKTKQYRRPPIFQGNYPDAPRNSGLGAVSLLAAIGKWTVEHRNTFPELYEDAEKLLPRLAGRPLYIISYGGSSQQSFGHHLVGMAMSGSLHEAVKALPFTTLVGVEDARKFSDPKWNHLKRTFDHFLRFFTRSSWRDFLAIRAYYSIEFSHLFKIYFMDQLALPEAWVTSAMAYGRSLNTAAYKAAFQEHKEDIKANRKGRGLEEYKNRVLVQFESTIRSAKSHSALLSQIGTIVGRLTLQEIHSDAGLFMQKVAEKQIDLDTAKELMTAFMRLSTYRPKEKESPDAGIEENQTEEQTQEFA